MAAKLEKILMRMMLHLPMTEGDIIRSKGGAQALKTSRLPDDNGLEVIRLAGRDSFCPCHAMDDNKEAWRMPG